MAVLASNDINTLKDFLSYFPKAHEDRQSIAASFTDQPLLGDSSIKQKVRVLVTDKKVTILRSKKRVYEIYFQDEQGIYWKASYRWSWYQFQNIEKNQRYVVIGKPKMIKNKITFSSPEFVPSMAPDDDSVSYAPSSLSTWVWPNDAHNIGRLYPIYSEMLGIKSSWFAKKMREVLPHSESAYLEFLPEDFRNEFDLPDLASSIKAIHYPVDHEQLKRAKYRLYFDRLLKLQLQSIANKQHYQWTSFQSSLISTIKPLNREVIKTIIESLSFQLTNAQKKVIKQIIQDFYEPTPMLRLLQGDVWSGKTIVAAIVAYYMIKYLGKQVAFLVPIEVLAQQHFNTLVKLFHPLGINVRLLTWSITWSLKAKIKQELKAGMINLIIWTHAVIQDDVGFRDLGLVIIDEQHKFWVRQRSLLKQHHTPHILQMTATPIPRTLALACFAEFQVSIIDELPAWRKPIITKVVWTKERPRLKWWIIDRINKGQSVFVVVPLISESDYLEWVHSAESVYAEYCSEFGSQLWMSALGLMHGKLSSKEKESIMSEFKQWTCKILVSTTVIEVWVDVPQATIMIIKNAERFGLSQLHQLRGRVGRSDLQSYCFLESSHTSWNQRLQAMENTNDGFKLAEIDMQLRWIGELLWTRQSGESDIPLEALMDMNLIEKVQQAAKWLVKHYPKLSQLNLLNHEIDYIEGELLA